MRQTTVALFVTILLLTSFSPVVSASGPSDSVIWGVSYDWSELDNDQETLTGISPSEIFQDLEEGMEVTGYIKTLREDGKIDVSLRPQGFRNVIDSDVDKLLRKLEASREGFVLLTDKSSPEAIRFQMQMSKKAFKKAVGNLYKQKRISIESDRIVLIKA